MKALMAGAVICTLAAVTHAETPRDSWIAMSAPLDTRATSGDGEESFAAASSAPGIWREADNWRRIDGDQEFWKPDGNDRDRGSDMDDLDTVSPAPEPSSLQLIALGAALLAFLRMGRRSPVSRATVS